jgi:hypothetical protein
VRRSTALLGVGVAVLCLVSAGCGKKSGRLSASDYKAELATVAKESDQAQAGIALGLKAKTVAELRTRVAAFGVEADRIGGELDKLKPPKDAEQANAELARGEHDIATAIRSVLPGLSKLASPKAAIALLDKQEGGAKGGREIDHALAQLSKLGYTKVS